MKRTKKSETGMIRTKPAKRGAGRTGVFQHWMIEDAEELTGKLGARNIDLAVYFEVCDATIDYWIKNKPEFARAVKRGRIEAALKASQALFQKAIGYSHPDIKWFMDHVKTYDVNGNLIEEHREPISVPIVKHYPPDTTAAIKYLSIIFRDVWAETARIDHTHTHGGSIDIRKVEELSMDDLSDEVKALLFSVNMKQLSDAQNN